MMKILTNKRELNVADLQEILTAHNQDQYRKRRLKNYYLGKHDILHKEGRSNSDINAPNNKIVSNYPAYITNMSVGFFIGQPIVYKSISENQEQVDALLEIFKYNDEAAHNLELAEEVSITGEAYELLYMDSDAEIRFTAVPSEEIIFVCDFCDEKRI